MLLYEFKADLNAYLAGARPDGAGRRSPISSSSTRSTRTREMPYFGQEIFEKAQKKGPLDGRRPTSTRSPRCSRLRAPRGIDAVMTQHRLDALVAPTSGPATLIDLVNGDYGSGGSSSAPAVAGYPHITVPAASSSGLPVGISFFGRAVERADAVQARLRVRAGDEAQEAAPISADSGTGHQSIVLGRTVITLFSASRHAAGSCMIARQSHRYG